MGMRTGAPCGGPQPESEKKQKCTCGEQSVRQRCNYWLTAWFAYTILFAFLAYSYKLMAYPADTVGNYMGWGYFILIAGSTVYITVLSVRERKGVAWPKKSVLLSYVKVEFVVAFLALASIGASMYLKTYTQGTPEDEFNMMVIYIWMGSLAALFTSVALWDLWRYKKTPPPPRPYLGGAGGLAM